MPLSFGNSAFDADEPPIKEGDFSLHQPTSFYHGSPKNLVKKGEGLKPSAPYIDLGGVQAYEAPEGVYLTPSRSTAERYGQVHQVNLPRKTKLSVDPLGTDFPHHGAVYHEGPISGEHVTKPPRKKKVPLHEQEGDARSWNPIGYPREIENPINKLDEYREGRKMKNLLYKPRPMPKRRGEE